MGEGAEEARRALARYRPLEAEPRRRVDREQDGHRERRDGRCAGGAGLSRARAGVHREHGLVLQPRGV